MTKRNKNCPRIFNNFLYLRRERWTKKEKTKCFILLYIVWRYYEPLKSEEKDEEGSRSIFCHDKHSKLSISSSRRKVKMKRNQSRSSPLREKEQTGTKKNEGVSECRVTGPSTGAALRGWPVYWIPQKFLTTPLFERRPFSPSREISVPRGSSVSLARSSTPPPLSLFLADKNFEIYRLGIPVTESTPSGIEIQLWNFDSDKCIAAILLHCLGACAMWINASLDRLKFREQTSPPSIFYADSYDLHIDWNYNFEIFVYITRWLIELAILFLYFLFLNDTRFVNS